MWWQFVASGLLMSTSLVLSPLRAEEPKPTAEMKELVKTIRAGLKSNREQIGRVEIKLTSVLVSPDVKEARRVTQTHPDGTQIGYDEAPRFDTPIHIVLDQEKIRHTILDKDGQPRQIVIFDGKLWTQYIPRDQLAWIRTPEQRAGGTILDPLEFGMFSLEQGLEEVLAAGELLSAKRERPAKGGEIVKVEIRHPQSVRWYFEFDSAANFLPRVIGGYNPDEKSFAVLTFRTHKQVEGSKAWFLKEADLFIPGDKTGKPIVPAKFHQKSSLIVKSITPFDPDSDIEQDSPFEIDLPPGTGIRDVVNRRSYQKGGPNDPNRK